MYDSEHSGNKPTRTARLTVILATDQHLFLIIVESLNKHIKQEQSTWQERPQ
jgi:hypothetical protein